MREELKNWFRVVYALPDIKEILNPEEWTAFVDDLVEDVSDTLQNVAGEKSVSSAKVGDFLLGLLTVLKTCPVPGSYLPTLRFQLETLSLIYGNIRVTSKSAKSRFPEATVGEIIETFIEMVEERSGNPPEGVP